MNAAELLADLTRLGIQLVAHGDRLKYSPRSAVTPDLLKRLQAHKGALLAILRPAGGPDAATGGPVTGGLRATGNRTVAPFCLYGRPVGSIDPPPACPGCGGLELWESLAGTWHCRYCDSVALERSHNLAENLADRAKRLRAGERVPVMRRRWTSPARASSGPVVEHDEAKGASLEKQRVLFDGISGTAKRKGGRRLR